MAVARRLLLAALALSLAGTECGSRPAQEIRFSVNSHRNATGHWLAEASVEHFPDVPGSEFEHPRTQWTFDVSFGRRTCWGRDSLVTVIKVGAPTNGPTSNHTVPDGAAAPAFRRSNYTLAPGLGYYKLHIEEATWLKARKTCEREGSHLVTIDSKAEFFTVAQIAAGIQTRAFVGYRRSPMRKEFTSVLGEPGDFAQAKLRKLEEDPFERCVAVSWRAGRGLVLATTVCSVPQRFICEQSL